MNSKKKTLHPLLVAAIVLLALSLILCTFVFTLWLHGKNTMTQTNSAPHFPHQDENVPLESSNRNIIEYNNKRYQYNENMINILLVGIDSDLNPSEAAGSVDQADVLVLAALNLEDKEMSLINLSRDIVCDIEITDNNGQNAELVHTQLALSYAYGDGQHGSCELTRDAVSNIFYGLPIQGYGAYYINGIADLNDAVGGVTVDFIYDYPYWVCGEGAKRLTEELHGTQVTLSGTEAVVYVRMRDEEAIDANERRIVRQKQYMLGLISQAKKKLLENPVSLLTIYDAVDDYILTDLSFSDISYLATQAVSMDFTEDIRNVSGDLLVNDEGVVEVHVDQDALYALMLDVFYTEI